MQPAPPPAPPLDRAVTDPVTDAVTDPVTDPAEAAATLAPASDTASAAEAASAPEAASAADAPLLPISRGRCVVDLIMRDPDWAWAPWELTADGVEAGLRTLGVFSTDARFVMRFYNAPRLTASAPAADAGFTEEVELPSWIGARYLLLGRPDTFHAVAVGLCDPSGRFHALARSPWTRAPRSRPAPPSASPRFITTTRAVSPDGAAKLSARPVEP